MSLYENGSGSNMVMPVGPMYGNGGSNGGFGWGDGSFWIIVLFLFAIMGNNGFGGWGGAGNGGMMPYIMNNNTGSEVQRGFDQQSVMGGINGITAGINTLAQSQCTGFANMATAMNSGFANIETSANARQMADMQQAFAAQTAMTAGMNTIASNLQNCCCENRASVADLKYTVANEACSDRAAVTAALQEVTAQNNANTQRILDQMCQDKIDAKNEKIADLQNQLTMANLAASQNAQTAQILANNEAQTAALEQYLAPVPRPAYVVQNPSCCNQMYGWGGCGCGNM